MTPLFVAGKLRAVFVLPSQFSTDQLRDWRRTVNTWQASGRIAETSELSDVPSR
jgi:hypothetical protein